MEKLFMATLISASLLSTGCSTVINGSDQDVFVKTMHDDNPKETECVVSTNRQVRSVDANRSVNLHRDEGLLVAECENEAQRGVAEVEPDFGGVIWGNLIIGGIIGAVIDANTDAHYTYPDVMVRMKDKEGAEDVPTPLIKPLPVGEEKDQDVAPLATDPAVEEAIETSPLASK